MIQLADVIQVKVNLVGDYYLLWYSIVPPCVPFKKQMYRLHEFISTAQTQKAKKLHLDLLVDYRGTSGVYDEFWDAKKRIDSQNLAVRN